MTPNHLDTVGVGVDTAISAAAPLVDVVHGVRHRLQVNVVVSVVTDTAGKTHGAWWNCEK